MAKNEKNQSVPKGAFHRSSLLLKAGAKIAARELQGRIDNLWTDQKTVALARRTQQAYELVKTLGEMKGAAMKAGQLLSLEASDLLPPEVVTILHRLHDSAPGVSETEVRRILAKEWGAARLADVENLSSQPIAAASIGQVHTAFIEGKKVAIKVQYPGVDKSIDSDLALVKKVAQGFLALNGKKIDIDALFSDIAQSLKSEANYLHEAESMQRYKRLFINDPRFIVPGVWSEWTTSHVLCMDYVEGDRLSRWLASSPAAEERQKLAELILDLLVCEFFREGFMQTDPNYGNFFLQTPAQHNAFRLVLLDCGATQEYTSEFRRSYLKFLQTVYNNEREDAFHIAYQMELLDPRESAEAQQAFWELLQSVVDLFRPQTQPCAFGDSNQVLHLRTKAMEMINKVKFTVPPRHLLFFNRKVGGMFHLLKDLGVKIDLHDYWLKIQRMSLEE